jgi:hypothetical protein
MNEESAEVKIKKIGDAFLMRKHLFNLIKAKFLWVGL